MSEIISHEGIIETIEHGHARVRFIQTSACSGCKLASSCTSSEAKDKVVDVFCDNVGEFSIGEKVTVMAHSSMGFLAVAYGFCIPLIVMSSVIFIADTNGFSETWSALCGLFSLLPVYLAMRLMNRYFERKISFTMKH